MKRALVYASVASMIQQFNMQNIRLLQESGYEVDVLCNLKQGSTITDETIAAMCRELEAAGVRVHHIPVPRKITAIGDIIRSFRMTRDALNRRQYDLIHCHSPIGGVLCRLANRFSTGYGRAKMIYTAHGFHFFRGAPWQNWLIFYPLEWLCSRYTDTLITINREDYALARERLKAKQVVYVPGIGVDVDKFRAAREKQATLEKLGLTDADTILLSVGELSVRKNHEAVLRALSKEDFGDYKYLICGLGALEQQLKALAAELGLEDRVQFLGYRSDIPQIMNVADLYIFPSLQEGLPVALMEAMACGLPVVASSIRGNTDLIDPGEGGYLVRPDDADGFAGGIRAILSDRALSERMKRHNLEKVRSFSLEAVTEQMAQLYKGVV